MQLPQVQLPQVVQPVQLPQVVQPVQRLRVRFRVVHLGRLRGIQVEYLNEVVLGLGLRVLQVQLLQVVQPVRVQGQGQGQQQGQKQKQTMQSTMPDCSQHGLAKQRQMQMRHGHNKRYVRRMQPEQRQRVLVRRQRVLVRRQRVLVPVMDTIMPLRRLSSGLRLPGLPRLRLPSLPRLPRLRLPSLPSHKA